MEKLFKVKEAGSSVRVEIMAGITTFFAMAYIIFVQPNMLVDAGGNRDAVFIATCLSAALGTLLMAFYAKLPFAQASGMGLNAFFTYTVCLGSGYSYEQGLAIVLLSGLLFILITAVGLREIITKAIPHNVRVAISAGIGLFIAFIGLLNSGIVVRSEATTVEMVSFTTWNAGTASAVVALLGLLVMGVLMKLKVKGAILIGIIAATLVGIPMGVTNVDLAGVSWLPNFSAFASEGLGAAFRGFSGLLDTSGGVFTAISSLVMIIITFSMVDMFDTIGTLVGTATKAGMMDKDGNMPGMKKAMMSDAIATAAGAIMGTSTVTTYVESSTGISEGGKTGLTSLTTGVLFILALFLAPLVGIVPSAATAPAFIIVGVLMLGSIKDLDLEDMTEAIPAFLTVSFMPFTYSISNGIAAGLISYVLLKLFTGRVKEINWVTYIIAALFLVKYIFMG